MCFVDDEPERPVYIPTPKIQPPKLLTLGTISKQNKLEYVPTKPQINDAPQTKNYSPNTNTVPVYVPSNTIKLNLSSVDKFNLDECASEIDLIDEVIEAQFSETEDVINQEIKGKSTTETKEVAKAAQYDKSAAKKNSSKNSTRSSSKSDQRSSSSRSSSRHRHKKSSTSDKEHKDKSSNRDKKSSSSKSSKHSSHNSKSSAYHRSSTSHHKSSSSSSRYKDKGKESRNSKSSSYRSSSSSKKLPQTKHDANKVTKPVEEIKNSDDRSSDANVYLSDDDDMDIEAQCKMIFEQFSPKTAGASSPIPIANTLKRRSSSDEDTNMDDNLRKKRIAHENYKSKQEIAPPARSRPNHVQTAIRV